MNISNILNVKKNYFESKNISNKNNVSFENSLNDALKLKEDEKTKEACVQFESYFLKMMLYSMRRTTNLGDGIFSKSNAENIFQDMYDEQISNIVASGNNGIGLADMLYKQLNKK